MTRPLQCRSVTYSTTLFGWPTTASTRSGPTRGPVLVRSPTRELSFPVENALRFRIHASTETINILSVHSNKIPDRDEFIRRSKFAPLGKKGSYLASTNFASMRIGLRRRATPLIHRYVMRMVGTVIWGAFLVDAGSYCFDRGVVK